MDEFSSASYHEAIKALQSICESLGFSGSLLRDVIYKYLHRCESVTGVNCNVPTPPKKNCWFPLLSTLLISSEWGFFPHQPIPQVCGHQLGVLQFNTDRKYQELELTPQFKGSVHNTLPHFICRLQGPGHHLDFCHFFCCVL